MFLKKLQYPSLPFTDVQSLLRLLFSLSFVVQDHIVWVSVCWFYDYCTGSVLPCFLLS